MQTEQRSKFSGKIGFILAAAGSAVGLGNIWRFPYLAAKYGGGVFLLTYLVLVVTFGFSLMVAEFALGRKTGLSPIGAFKKFSSKYTFIGVIASLIAFFIIPYYSVIGGWVIKYLTMYITGNHAAVSADNFFGSYIASPITPIIFQGIFVLATAFVIIRGVKNGIEKFSKILMPILILLSIVICIFSVTRPGALEGVKYYLIPDFSKFSIQTVVAAMGQMFYSMSLAMGIMITYGSYLKKEHDLEKCVGHIEIFDTGIAILAGLMIIPAIYAFPINGVVNVNQGPGLMFITLPKVFEAMGMSTVVGVLFFLLVLFAALTSAISLMEAIVATVCDQFHISRNKAVLIVTSLTILIGIPPSLGYSLWDSFTILGMQILDFMDFLTNALLMPVCALLTCLFIGFVIKPKTIIEEVKLSSKFGREKLFYVMIKYIAPVLLVVILISSILNQFGIIKL